MKRLIATATALLMVVSPFMKNAETQNISALAASFYREIDNDPVASGYSTIYNGTYTYISAYGCYNGDARRAVSNYSNTYFWYHPTDYFPAYKNITIGLSVYLNNVNFTDPGAVYSVLVSGAFKDICTIDQLNAPGTWSPEVRVTVPYFSASNQVHLSPSNTYGTYTGADAVRVHYTY